MVFPCRYDFRSDPFWQQQASLSLLLIQFHEFYAVLINDKCQRIDFKNILSEMSHFENPIFDKIHVFKIPFFTKFTFSKPKFSQNSHFQNSIFHKIDIVKISMFTKFTFFKHQIPGNFRIKSGVLTLFNTFGKTNNSNLQKVVIWNGQITGQKACNSHSTRSVSKCQSLHARCVIFTNCF